MTNKSISTTIEVFDFFSVLLGIRSEFWSTKKISYTKLFVDASNSPICRQSVEQSL